MRNTLIVITAIVVTLFAASPLAIDYFANKKVSEYLEIQKVHIKKTDPSANLTHGDVTYNIFNNLVTIDNLSYSSSNAGLYVNLGSAIFTPIRINEKSALEELPDSAVINIINGKLKVDATKLPTKSRANYNFIAGKDGYIDFSVKLLGIFDDKMRQYDYKSSFFVENTGTLSVDFSLNGIYPDNAKLQEMNQQELNQHLLKNLSINDLKISLLTKNLRGALNNFIDIGKYTDSEAILKSEVEALAIKISKDPATKGFEKPVKDISNAYFSDKNVKLSFSTTKELTGQLLMTIAFMNGAGNFNVSNYADLLGIEIESEIR